MDALTWKFILLFFLAKYMYVEGMCEEKHFKSVKTSELQSFEKTERFFVTRAIILAPTVVWNGGSDIYWFRGNSCEMEEQLLIGA